MCPGWIDTEMTGAWKDDHERSDYVLSLQSVKRYGEAHEVAALVQWLCSAAAAFVNGVAWPIDCGLSA